MLVHLNVDENYLLNLKKDLEDSSKFDLSRISNLDGNIINGFIETIEKVKGLSMNDIKNSINEIYKGIYETPFSIETLSDIMNIKFKEYNHFESKSEYGMADNYEQILDFYPELNASDKKYIVICEWLYRDDNNPGCGFRYHKNGIYIGNLNPTHEHFNDDTHIKKLLLYHVIEVLEENVQIHDYTDNWVDLTQLI